MLDDGARFHVIAHLIREAVDCGKLMLATSIVGRDDLLDTSSVSKESGTIQNLIQKDRVRIAVCLIIATSVLIHINYFPFCLSLNTNGILLNPMIMRFSGFR